MMRGKSIIDIAHTILTLAQIVPVLTLSSLHETFGAMLRTKVLEKMRNIQAAKFSKEETLEEDE